jgi:hypothetical protein
MAERYPGAERMICWKTTLSAGGSGPRPELSPLPAIVIPLGHIRLDVASLVDGSEV